jgi:hypothetical protein
MRTGVMMSMSMMMMMTIEARVSKWKMNESRLERQSAVIVSTPSRVLV